VKEKQPAILKFRGDHRFLSNFWPSKVYFPSMDLTEVIEGEVMHHIYPSVEHAYQASKTRSLKARKLIQNARSPSRAKRLGQSAKLRPNWEEYKFIIMADLVRQKFFEHEILGQKLLETGDRLLVEGNTWGDRTWGVCNGRGKNHLGKILMRVRLALLKDYMGEGVSYVRLRDNYLVGRDMNDLKKVELKELSRFLDLDPDELPRSYQNARHMKSWIDNWIAHEIIQDMAKKAGEARA